MTYSITPIGWTLTVYEDSVLPGSYFIEAVEKNSENPRRMRSRDNLSLIELQVHPFTASSFKGIKESLRAASSATVAASIEATVLQMTERDFDLAEASR
jgi:hypothetical protein